MFSFFKKKDFNLYAPVTGQMIPIEEVPDEMFAQKLMGDGVGLKFETSRVCAPCDGEITMIANTSHAFSIKAANGAEILIHIGLDTVQLKGQGFKVLTTTGTKVKKGTPIIEVDQEVMKQKQINLITPMVITNGQEFKMDIVKTCNDITAGKSVVVSFK